MRNIKILLISLIFLNCSAPQKEEYFEGTITYTVISETWDNKHDSSEGDTMIYYTKDGFIRRIYKNSTGIQESLYVPDENKMYTLVRGIDTLYYNDMKKNSTTLVEFTYDKSTSQEILKRNCNRLVVKFWYGEEPNKSAFNETYYFASDLKLNPEHFKDFKFNFWDRITNETKSFYLYYEVKTIATHLILNAFQVERKSLDRNFFKVRDDLPMKELKF